MKEVHTNLFIGDDADCRACTAKPEFAIVHACKTCHQKALNYPGALPATHPHYLVYEHGKNLYLNMVDMPTEFLPKFTHPLFGHAMDFIDREIKTKKVLIHCNYGASRSPSLGLTYLAITGVISKNSIEEAAAEFEEAYPKYAPGMGILFYMKRYWDFLMHELLEKDTPTNSEHRHHKKIHI